MADVEPEEGELSVSFDGRSVTYGFGELDTLVPAYAASIHKSQGSEYPAVVIPVMTQHYAMLQRNFALYRRHPRQAACPFWWAEEGRRYRRAQRLRPAALVEAGGMAQRGQFEALEGGKMSGVTEPPWRSRLYLASRKCGTSQLHLFKHAPDRSAIPPNC